MSILARNLLKNYGVTRAVDGVSFEIPGPGVVGLIGPNGAGKTTTLRMLTSYLTPTAGFVRVAGYESTRQSRELRRHLGYLPESSALCHDARIEELLTFRAKLKGVPRRKRAAEIERCLQQCGLTNLRRRIIGRLSHGQRRRVALAEALLNDPPVLILDEPTAGLDPLQVRQFRELLQQLAHDHTILLSTHVLAEAEAVCSRVLIISQGRLVDDIDLQSAPAQQICRLETAGPLEVIKAALANLTAVAEVNCLSSDNGWHHLELQIASQNDLREQIAALCVQHAWPIRELAGSTPTLEAQFVRALFSETRKAA